MEGVGVRGGGYGGKGEVFHFFYRSFHVIRSGRKVV